jgi:hypothetical protein
MNFFYALTMEYTSDSTTMADVAGLYRHTCGSGNPTKCNQTQTNWGLLNFYAGAYWGAPNPDLLNYWNYLANAHGVN